MFSKKNSLLGNVERSASHSRPREKQTWRWNLLGVRETSKKLQRMFNEISSKKFLIQNVWVPNKEISKSSQNFQRRRSCTHYVFITSSWLIFRFLVETWRRNSWNWIPCIWLSDRTRWWKTDISSFMTVNAESDSSSWRNADVISRKTRRWREEREGKSREESSSRSNLDCGNDVIMTICDGMMTKRHSS